MNQISKHKYVGFCTWKISFRTQNTYFTRKESAESHQTASSAHLNLMRADLVRLDESDQIPVSNFPPDMAAYGSIEAVARTLKIVIYNCLASRLTNQSAAFLSVYVTLTLGITKRCNFYRKPQQSLTTVCNVQTSSYRLYLPLR